MGERYVVRTGTERKKGLYVGDFMTEWPDQKRAFVFRTEEDAERSAARHGGRVVRLRPASPERPFTEADVRRLGDALVSMFGVVEYPSRLDLARDILAFLEKS